MVKMKDVAARAGVSVATVSNVFTGKHFVSPEARSRVLNAVEDLDYHINLNARGLKTVSTNTIGVVLPDITKLFFNDVLRGILETAHASDYRVTVLSSGYDYAYEKECISNLRGMNVDAIIIDSCCDYHNLKEWAYELASYEGKFTPVVSIESAMDTELVSSVMIDTYYWSNKITQHLLSLGRKKIMYISGPSYLRHERDRLAGYKQALRDSGIKVSNDLIVSNDFSSGASYDTVSAALNSSVEFDAIQASNDQAAIGAIKALKEHGLKVPDDIPVSGFDNLFPSTLVEPAVTTISVPRYELGSEAVNECIRHINDPSLAPRSLVLSANIIKRGSTVPDSSSPWELVYW